MNILDIAIAKKLAGGGGGSGTDNYNDLSNLPKINDTTLSGNKSSSALGLQSEINSDSKLASDLVDDTNQDNKFVTSTEKNTWNGKQNAIDADHKINADYVDDSTSTNKFVTASDKETWNAKQNAIDNSHKLSSDLVDDTNHTNKFVTSTEKNTWNAKQNAIDADHKLSSSLVSFTTAEAAALASGIDSTKVGQISTNQTNILYALNTGVRNICNNAEYSDDTKTAQNTTFTTLDDGTVTVKTPSGQTSTTDANNFYNVWFVNTTTVVIPEGTWMCKLYGTDISNIRIEYAYTLNGTSTVNRGNFGEALEIVIPTGVTASWLRICAKPSTSFNSSFKIVVCDKSVWEADPPTEYIPFALPNSDLTYLEAEDRAALAEEIDAGAKQLAQGQNNSGSAGTATIQSDGYTVKLTGSAASSSSLSFATTGTIQKTGTYVFAIEASGTMDRISIWDNTTSASIETLYATGSTEVTLTAGHSYALFHYAGSAITLNATVKYMICTKAAFGVSQKFAPYRPNWDLVASELKTLEGMIPATTIVSSGSLNDVSVNTFAIYKSAVSDRPISTDGWFYVKTTVFDVVAGHKIQEATALSDGTSYIRVQFEGTWKAWKQTTNA